MIKYLNEAIDPSWAKRIKENNPNAYAILYGWQYKNEPEVEIAPEVYMDKVSLDRRLNQVVTDYSIYSQISPRGNRYAKESDILFYILYPSSLGESKTDTVTSNKIGYRNHEYYGANETGLDSIIQYEIGELGNSDIIDTVLDTFQVNAEEKHTLEAALDILEDEGYLGDTALDLVVKTLLNIIWKKYPNARYGLWLCETPDAVERWYDGNKDNILTYRIENEQPISDLGFNDQGCLFVYDKPIGNYNNKIEALREDLVVDRVAIFGTNDKKLEDVCKKFKNKIRVVRDACEDINGFLAMYLCEEGYTDVYTIRGMFKVDTFDWVALKDFSSKELYQIRKTYGNSSKRSLLKYVESLPADIQKEFYYIPHTWCELPGGIIIDAAWKMFEPYIEGELSKSHYYHFDQIEDITVYSGYTVKTMRDHKMYGKDYLDIRRKLTESQSKQNDSKVYKLDDITKRQVQRNPLYSKYRVEVVELEPLVTQLMNNTSILGRRTDNWGDSFDKFHIKSNKAYWYNDPIRLVKLNDDEYKVLDGNHRLIALYNDGWKQVECLVKDSQTAKIEESLTEDVDNIKTPEQLMDWMEQNITYELANDEYGAEDDPPTKTAEEVIETGTGHCAEQSYLEYKVLDELGYFPQLIFVKENNSKKDYSADGSAHMFVVYQDEDEKYTYFEHSQEHNKGIHKFDSMSELLDFVGKNWWRYDANSNILEVRYIDEPITGVDNWELAKECHKYPVDEVLDISNNVMEKDVPLDAKWDFDKHKIIEEAYHFGNLEYGRKADKRGIMAGRGTGHFGTGFYIIGSVTDDTDYNGRELWEIDLTKYNLFKPRSNNAGYTLHDTLKKLNSLFYRYKYNNYTPDMFKLKPYDLRIKLDDFEYEYGNEGIIKFIDSYFPAYREAVDREINMGRWGAAEQVAYDSIEDFEDFVDDLDFVVNQLELIFPKEIGKVENIVWSLIKDNELDDQDNVDSISTLFIKKMGYEGVDVTHLNKAEDGLSGLDNFSYGSVVYDLKPGTYRKIRDKKEK